MALIDKDSLWDNVEQMVGKKAPYIDMKLLKKLLDEAPSEEHTETTKDDGFRWYDASPEHREGIPRNKLLLFTVRFGKSTIGCMGYYQQTREHGMQFIRAVGDDRIFQRPSDFIEGGDMEVIAWGFPPKLYSKEAQ